MSFKFIMTRKGETSPVNLLVVDVEMCQHFNVPEDQDWHHGWVDDVSSGLVSGFSLKDQAEREQIRIDKLSRMQRNTEYKDENFQWSLQDDIDQSVHRVAILRWLDDNFTACCWSPVGVVK